MWRKLAASRRVLRGWAGLHTLTLPFSGQVTLVSFKIFQPVTGELTCLLCL